MSCAAQPVLASRTSSSEQKTTASNGILVVEDEPLVREVTGEVLRSAGYLVWTAKDAQEAIATFSQWQSDIRLLIIDVTLPDLAGPTLARKLSDVGDGVCTLLTSGYPEPATPDRAVLRHCKYLAKPFSADSLLREVRNSLREAGVAGS